MADRSTDSYKKAVAEYVTEAREVLGMTKQEFADKLKVSSRTVAYWEDAEKVPNTPTLRYIGILAQSQGHNVHPPEE